MLYSTICPPVPGWDAIEKTCELVEGGQDEHGLIFSNCRGYTSDDFVTAIRNLAGLPPKDNPNTRSFHQWLRDAEWARSGSSSLGRVEYELAVDGEVKRGHFKAWKNFLLDVESLDVLEDRVRHSTTPDNVALIKTELSKIRLAVSSPVETYLAQAWLFLVSGNAYANWPANKLEEPLSKELARLETTWERLKCGSTPCRTILPDSTTSPPPARWLRFKRLRIGAHAGTSKTTNGVTLPS